jgi:hypothetical protein
VSDASFELRDFASQALVAEAYSEMQKALFLLDDLAKKDGSLMENFYEHKGAYCHFKKAKNALEAVLNKTKIADRALFYNKIQNDLEETFPERFCTRASR